MIYSDVVSELFTVNETNIRCETKHFLTKQDKEAVWRDALQRQTGSINLVHRTELRLVSQCVTVHV